MNARYDDCWNECFEAGAEYERYVYRLLMESFGHVVEHCDTARSQWLIGENRQGLEIKLDRKFVQTSNLFIETRERARLSGGGFTRWKMSGPFRRDNNRWLLIGDYMRLWVFHSAVLRAESATGWRKIYNITAEGFLLPVKAASRKCLAQWIDGDWVRQGAPFSHNLELFASNAMDRTA